jgi:hypothetical protein
MSSQIFFFPEMEIISHLLYYQNKHNTLNTTHSYIFYKFVSLSFYGEWQHCDDGKLMGNFPIKTHNLNR